MSLASFPASLLKCNSSRAGVEVSLYCSVPSNMSSRTEWRLRKALWRTCWPEGMSWASIRLCRDDNGCFEGTNCHGVGSVSQSQGDERLQKKWKWGWSMWNHSALLLGACQSQVPATPSPPPTGTQRLGDRGRLASVLLGQAAASLGSLGFCWGDRVNPELLETKLVFVHVFVGQHKAQWRQGAHWGWVKEGVLVSLQPGSLLTTPPLSQW
jgi:hypothetical protein